MHASISASTTKGIKTPTQQNFHHCQLTISSNELGSRHSSAHETPSQNTKRPLKYRFPTNNDSHIPTASKGFEEKCAPKSGHPDWRRDCLAEAVGRWNTEALGMTEWKRLVVA